MREDNLLKDVALHYTECGEGDLTIVFLHFFAGSSRSWLPLASELKNSFHCLCIDLYGFGHSPAPAKELSVYESAYAVETLIARLPIKGFVLVGHSMGGKIALQIASHVPAKLFSLVLLAPSPPSPEPMDETQRSSMMNAFREPVKIEKVLEHITHLPLSENIFNEVVEDHLKASKNGWMGWLQKGSRENLTKKMEKIKEPVCIMSGQYDPNFSTAFLKNAFSNLIPQATYLEIPAAGHLLPLEAPLLIAGELISFISKVKTPV